MLPGDGRLLRALLRHDGQKTIHINEIKIIQNSD